MSLLKSFPRMNDMMLVLTVFMIIVTRMFTLKANILRMGRRSICMVGRQSM